MADHVFGILGGGEVSKKFLTDTLNSLQGVADAAEEGFWVILPYELEDNALTNAVADTLEWVEGKNIWARVYADKPEKKEEQPAVEEFIVVGKSETVAQRMVKDLVEEGGELLVIAHTVDWDEPKAEDADLIEAITAANQNGVPVKQLNNGMMELDLTEEGEAPAGAPETDQEGPSESDVRKMGVDADKGDEDAAGALQDLGMEYGIDVGEDPYASMSWVEFAEAVLTADAEKANADVAPVAAEKQPQPHDREKLEKMQLRSLRSLAIAEGWGNQIQNTLPKWYLVDHIAAGTVPPDDLDPTTVPDQRPVEGEAPKKARGASKKAVATEAPVPDTNGAGGGVDFARISEMFAELSALFAGRHD